MVFRMKDKFNLVGTKILEFELSNSRGVTKNIRDLQGQNVVLVLFRSKTWPYAKAHAQKLSKDYEKFKELNATLYTILPDNLESAKMFEENFAKNKFPIFYDQTKKVNKMLKQEVKPLKLGRMPALLIIDKQGIIRYAYYSDSMSDIPENEVIIEVIKNLNN